ncbi:MAG: 5-formyltetrahydrofolate cyclo-ligase [Halioglobus sp.]|nr:5-formyltetrahydrofolate cyclo-ligase [Halioglobus sp.]
MHDLSAQKALLRRQLRERRAAISQRQQQLAASQLASIVSTLPGWDAAGCIALYLPNDGEIGTGPLADLARAQGKRLLLPVASRAQSLAFAQWNPGQNLCSNRYGIPEPGEDAPRTEPGDIDIVFLPLVGWDSSGGRLGMGAGYYDRTLAGIDGPLRVGLAHSVQQVERVPTDEKDVLLDFVATERALVKCGADQAGN